VIELQEFGIPFNPHLARHSGLAGFYLQPQPQIQYYATTSSDALDLSGDTADWVVEAAKKLEALGRFRTGWDSYGGLPLQRGAKRLTRDVLGWLRKDDLPVPAVVLGSGGSVQLEWRAKEKELEVELRDNNTIEFVKVSPTGDIEEGQAAADLPGQLRDLTDWFLCR
jgi:hypothetical protein